MYSRCLWWLEFHDVSTIRDCGGKMVQSVGYKARFTNTCPTNRMAWPWTSKVSKEVSQKKLNPTDKRHRPGKQKNVSSTARGKLARKRKTWSKSGAGTNYPRYSAPMPKRWLSDQRKNSAKEAHQPLRSFPAQFACAEPHGPAKCEWAHRPPEAECFHGWQHGWYGQEPWPLQAPRRQ